jgi:hypothetical protein
MIDISALQSTGSALGVPSATLPSEVIGNEDGDHHGERDHHNPPVKPSIEARLVWPSLDWNLMDWKYFIRKRRVRPI